MKEEKQVIGKRSRSEASEDTHKPAPQMVFGKWWTVDEKGKAHLVKKEGCHHAWIGEIPHRVRCKKCGAYYHE